MSNYNPEQFADLKAIATTPKVLQKLEAVEAEQARLMLHTKSDLR